MKGKVYLVGAGPGRKDLLTLRARELIDTADVILYDQLAGEILTTLPLTAELIDCGKFGNRHTIEQDEIEALMVTRAKEGKKVVRLKGGDPFLFGRGGEELETLLLHGIEVELVPGISSAIAVPGCIGIPVTHRACASQITIVTGHEDPTKERTSVRWDLLARFEGTIIILMGVKNLPAICDALITHGKSPGTPVAVIERGLQNDQRVTVSTISEITVVAKRNRVEPPAVIVIGDVVGYYHGMNLCNSL